MHASDLPLRVAVVGLGQWGSRLLAALLTMPEFTVVALCDTNPATLAASPGPPLRFARLAVMLTETDVDAVFVAVTPQAQAEAGLEVLRSGRHLFVEKPMALSARDAQLLVDAASAQELRVCVGHVVRYQPSVVEALRLVHAGAIGRVTRVICERIGARPRPGVSPWWILAPHDLSFLLAAFPGQARWLRVESDAQGATTASLALAGGATADLRVAAQGTPRRVTILLGDAGSLVVDEATSTLRRYSRALVAPAHAEPDTVVRKLGELSAEIRSFAGQPLQLELRAFFDGVRRGVPVATDVHDGYRVVSMLEAADEFLLGRARSAPEV